MSMKISPKDSLASIEVGDKAVYTLDISDELNGNTVSSHTFKIYDSDDSEVTSKFGGDSSESSGTITFGVKAYAVGTYTIKFWVTCNEVLPDSSTPVEFPVIMTATFI